MYCRMNAVPECLREGNGDLYTYSSTSAFWAFNTVANFAYSKYSDMRVDIAKLQNEWESYFTSAVAATDMAVSQMPDADARAYLTRFSCSQAESATASWRRRFEYLMVKYLDGQVRKEDANGFVRNEYGNPVGPNRKPFPEDFLRTIAPHTAHE